VVVGTLLSKNLPHTMPRQVYRELNGAIRTVINGNEGWRGNYCILKGPAWVRRPEDITGDTSSISFAFIDRDGSITQTMKKAHLAMFGKPITFAKWVSRPPLTQCS